MKIAFSIHAPLLACMFLVQPLLTERAAAQDIYIGTLEYREQRLVLRRCDLTETIYYLRDAAEAQDQAVSKFAGDANTRRGLWYAEVIGTYKEEGGQNALEVIDLQHIQAGRTCHLSDALPSAGGKERR